MREVWAGTENAVSGLGPLPHSPPSAILGSGPEHPPPHSTRTPTLPATALGLALFSPCLPSPHLPATPPNEWWQEGVHRWSTATQHPMLPPSHPGSRRQEVRPVLLVSSLALSPPSPSLPRSRVGGGVRPAVLASPSCSFPSVPTILWCPSLLFTHTMAGLGPGPGPFPLFPHTTAAGPTLFPTTLLLLPLAKQGGGPGPLSLLSWQWSTVALPPPSVPTLLEHSDWLLTQPIRVQRKYYEQTDKLRLL